MYLIDSNIFIEPYRSYYAFNIAPSFWQKLLRELNQSCWLLDLVKKEICPSKDSKDDLQIWIESEYNTTERLIRPLSNQLIVNKYSEILEYIDSCGYYKPESTDEWKIKDKADPWLIATALVKECTIVTMERGHNLHVNNPISKEPKIPDVCKAMGVRCIDLFEFMNERDISL